MMILRKNNCPGRENYLIRVVMVISLLLAFGLVSAQNDSLLTLKSIFTDLDFATKSYGPVRWLEEGDSYTTLEKSEIVNGRDIVRYECASGERTILVSAEDLIPEGKTDPLQIEDYKWSEDGKKLLVFTNAKRVWRLKTRGDYWVVDTENWEMFKLGRDAEPSTLMFANFSPQGDRVAYVREHNIYVEDLSDHSIIALTTSGTENLINGTFDWVYEEEFRIRNGFRWSPDGKKIAFWQLDADGVGTFNMVHNLDSVYSRVIPLQYPKVGTTNSSCKIGVVDAHGGEITWFSVPGDPRNHYIPRMDWAASSDEIIFQQLNRKQNKNRVFIGDAQSGTAKNIFTDEDSAWVEVVKDLKWLNNGQSFTWITEHDGWKQVYDISRDGYGISKITQEEYDIIEVLTIDDNSGWLYYIAAPNNPLERNLYRCRIDGPGLVEKLTPSESGGFNSYNISPNLKWAFYTHSTIDSPPVIKLISLPDHKSVRVMEDNNAVREKLAAIERKPVEFFKIDIGEDALLDGYKIVPPDFDPAKKYPLLFYVYGEPGSQTVKNEWGGMYYLWHTYLAQQGYVVVSIDNRGTASPRGRKWRKSVYRQIGIQASQDQAAAARVIRNWDFIDSTRIAIWGWSGGGSMSLNAIFRYPKLYQTAMAIAFISDQRLYDTIYQERFMDLPQNNPDGYRNGSPITFAHQLQGNLLLIHGTADDNCHYQSAEMLIDELITHNKMFTVVPYPGRAHSIYERKNSRRHLFETMTWYLMNHCKPGPVKGSKTQN